MKDDKIAELVEGAFREGWHAGEDEGRAYGFTGVLAVCPEKAWKRSKAKRKATSLRAALKDQPHDS